MKENGFIETEIGRIPEDWDIGIFNEDLKVKGRIGWKGYKTTDLRDSGPIVIGGINIKSNFYLDLTEIKHISREKFEESPEIVLKKGDVLLVQRGSNSGDVAYFDGIIEEVTINPSVIILSDFKGNSKFLFYYLISPIGKNNIFSIKSGSSIPAIYQADVLKLKYPKPSIKEQEKISNILLVLDDKIALNRSMNSTLEAIGQALFRRWFVDFEFPNEEGKPYRSSGGEMVETELGDVPRGWRVDLITEVAEVVDCLHIKKPTQTEKGSILLQLYNIGEYGLLDFKELYHVSQEDYKVWTKNILIKEGDCILTNAGLAGAIAQIPYGFEVGLGRNITAVRPIKITPAYLIRYLFSEYGEKEIQKNLDVGTIFNSLNVKGIRKFKMLIPNPEIMYKFETLARPLRKVMENNVYENLCLSEIRDALLPKLMSGEIRVNTIKHISMSNVV